MKHLLLPAFLTALLATPALAEGDHGHGHDHDDDHEAEHVFLLDGLEVLHPWTTAGHGDHAALFMELTNEGTSEIVILGAKSEDGATGSLVGMQLQDGDLKEMPIEAIPLAAGASLELKPDELSIHLDGLSAELEEGHHLEVILMTSKGELAIDVAIEAEDARQHSHAGHNH